MFRFVLVKLEKASKYEGKTKIPMEKILVIDYKMQYHDRSKLSSVKTSAKSSIVIIIPYLKGTLLPRQVVSGVASKYRLL
jgi:hypothetical protein